MGFGGYAVLDSEEYRPRGGHRVLPHTADVALDAWAPNRAECIAEAVRALVECFVDVTRAAAGEDVAVSLDPETDEDLLVAVLDEVIYQIEVHDRVAVDVEVDEEDAEDGGGTVVHLATVSATDVELIGAVPKAVAWHELSFACSAGTWRCHVTIDV